MPVRNFDNLFKLDFNDPPQCTANAPTKTLVTAKDSFSDPDGKSLEWYGMWETITQNIFRILEVNDTGVLAVSEIPDMLGLGSNQRPLFVLCC